MIYQITFDQVVTFWQMTYSFFPMFLMKTLPKMNWIMIYKRQVIGFFSGKCNSTLTQKHKHKKWFFTKKAESNNSRRLNFNKTEVRTCQSQKHLGLKMNGLISTEYINSNLSKCAKLIGTTNATRCSNRDETLRVVTIAMICFTLVLLWKFQYFRRPIYNPVEHLWWSFCCKNSKSLIVFTKKLHRRSSLEF